MDAMKLKIQFTSEKTFGAYYKAIAWCKDNGYSAGSMCRDMPIGLIKGECLIAKWRNLTAKEKNECDGYITCDGGFRDGDVIIEIKDAI